MKLRRLLSFVMVLVMLATCVSFAAAAYDDDLAQTSYYNQDYLENYAAKAKGVNDLGCTYSKNSTTWKVWSPVATTVMLKLYNTGTDIESGAGSAGAFKMEQDTNTGVWSLTMSGDYKNKYYTYVLTIDGETKETQDPYSKAVGANGDRSMVCDLQSTNPDGWENDKHVLFDNPGEAVVWEVHVRDFSIDVSSGVSEENRGKYLAFTEGNTTVGGKGKVATCVDYLVEHGVNCVQLMPIADFASIDETDKAENARNWGYDSKNFNVPDGAYASDPYDGNVRIKEYKMLIQALHDRGISVVMDVVYNHTFVLEGSALSMTVPKYYYRMSNTTDYCDGSGLGNVLSSEKTMTRKYILESIKYWANEYHVDGFRFDLMGCIDVPTMNNIRSELDKISTKILMYGEPWIGGSNNGISNGSTTANFSQLNSRIGGFNEAYSDGMKGDHGSAKKAGFVGGGTDSEVLNAARGNSSKLPGAVTQLVNYTDNHDNLCMFDKILAVNGKITAGEDSEALYEKNKPGVNNPGEPSLSQMKLGLTSALTTQGIPFTLAGTEFCRTKYGDGNSYRTPDNMNAIDWTRAQTYSDVSDYYAGLAAIRKAFAGFTGSTATSISTISGCTAYKITKPSSGKWSTLIVALNNTASAKSISCSGNWVVVANGKKAGTASLGTASGSYSVPAYSGVVLVDSTSFNNYVQPKYGTATLTVEHYTRDSKDGSYSKVKTQTAKYRDGQTYRASKDISILFDHDFDKFDSTTGAISGTAKQGDNITVKFYYTRNIKSNYLTVNFLNSSTKEPVKYRLKFRLKDGAPFSIPVTAVQGYELDSSKYPGGTIGTFDASKELSFNYYYKPLTNNETIVHYYNSRGWGAVCIYAYYSTAKGIVEPVGPWTKNTRMERDTELGNGWFKYKVPSTSFYVMFHPANGTGQDPGAGEQGYPVSGEAWIKDRVVTFNCSIVTSHIDLETGKQLAKDEVKNYTNVSSSAIYTTSPRRDLGDYVTPSNASGFYTAGVTNVVYLYTEREGPDRLLYGDADLDTRVTIVDATYVQQKLAGIREFSEDAMTVSDCDNDGKVTIVDATFIQRYLAQIETPGSRVGKYVDEPSGEHTFAEFVEKYNELTEEMKKYPESVYSDNEYYIAAKNAVDTYKALTMNPGATPEEIDKGYNDCDNAIKGLGNLEPYDPTDPTQGGGITLYFTNNKYWSNVNGYMWKSGSEGTWPGEPLTYVGDNDYGEGIYSVYVDLSAYDCIIFNDGNSGKTVDIPLSPSMQNGIYCRDEQAEDGGYEVGFYDYGGEDPTDPPTPIYGGTVYLEPSIWNVDGARFSAYFFGGSGDPVWVSMKYYSSGIYSADIPEGYSSVIFCRMNGATTENIWENKWNQTDDLSIQEGTYHISDWGEMGGNSPGYWG